MCFSSNVAGIMANKIEQSFYSVYSCSGIESIKHALKSTFSLNRKLYVFIKKKRVYKVKFKKRYHHSLSLYTNPPITEPPLHQSTNYKTPSLPIHQSKSSLSTNPPIEELPLHQSTNHRALSPLIPPITEHFLVII